MPQEDLEAAEDAIEQVSTALHLNGQPAGMVSVLTSSLYTASGAVLKDSKQLTTQAMQRWAPTSAAWSWHAMQVVVRHLRCFGCQTAGAEFHDAGEGILGQG